MPQEWKKSIIVLIHKKGDRMDCNNYRGISLFSTSHKILSNIILFACGVILDKSMTERILCEVEKSEIPL